MQCMDCGTLNHGKNKQWLEVHGHPKCICLMIALLKIISWLSPLNNIFWFISQSDLGAPELDFFQTKQSQDCFSHRWVDPGLCAGSHWSTLPPPQMQVVCASRNISLFMHNHCYQFSLLANGERYPTPEGKLTLCWLDLQECFRDFFVYILQ